MPILSSLGRHSSFLLHSLVKCLLRRGSRSRLGVGFRGGYFADPKDELFQYLTDWFRRQNCSTFLRAPAASLLSFMRYALRIPLFG